MDGIKDYLVNLISAVMLGSIADTLVSSFKTKYPGVEKTARLGISVCVLAIIIVPLTELLTFDNFYDEIKLQTESYENSESFYILEKEAEEKASEYIFKKTGIKPVSIVIKIIMKDNEKTELSQAVVTVESKYKEREPEIKQAGIESLGREVDIQYAD